MTYYSARRTETLQWSKFYAQYNKFNVDSYVPTSAGVYIIYVKLTSGNWKAIYVGQATSLKDRLLDHLRSSEPNSCLKYNVEYNVLGFEHAPVADGGMRDGIEKYLYDHFKPECNQLDPGGLPIAVNLP